MISGISNYDLPVVWHSVHFHWPWLHPHHPTGRIMWNWYLHKHIQNVRSHIMHKCYVQYICTWRLCRQRNCSILVWQSFVVSLDVSQIIYCGWRNLSSFPLTEVGSVILKCWVSLSKSSSSWRFDYPSDKAPYEGPVLPSRGQTCS